MKTFHNAWSAIDLKTSPAIYPRILELASRDDLGISCESHGILSSNTYRHEHGDGSVREHYYEARKVDIYSNAVFFLI